MPGIMKNTLVNVIMMCLMVTMLTRAVKGSEDFILLSTDYLHGTVGYLTHNDTQMKYCLPSQTFIFPNGVAYDSESNTVYVLEYYVGVYKFKLDGQSSPELVIEIMLAFLISIALDGEGNMFLTGEKTSAIYRININGTDSISWITGLDGVYGIVVDKRNRYVIWSDSSGVRRAQLENPTSIETIIRKERSRALYLDESENKLFMCDRSGRIFMANTDGSDAEVIIELKISFQGHITGYRGHLYATGDWLGTVFDIYNGSYSKLTTSNAILIGLTVVEGQIPNNVCNISCYNGGSIWGSTCMCLSLWEGSDCTDCSSTCLNGGTLDNGTCTCDCLPQWKGDRCQHCSSTCLNGGTLDNGTCTCDCLPQWKGDRCQHCYIICQNGGTLDSDSCTCDCLQEWSGDQCENCDMICQNGGTLDSGICKCECLPHWSGNECEILQQPIPSKNFPEITSSSPSFGPAAGGTWITITGTNFPLEYNTSITIADTTCDTKLQNTTTVIGITRGLRKNDIDIIGRPLPVSLKANNTVIINSSYEFIYKPNSVISKVFPTESIIKGGTLLTVDGDNLDSVAFIWMEVSMILKTLKSDELLVYDETRTTYTTQCQEVNSSRMFCPTPVLDVPSGFLNQIPQSTQTKRDLYRHIHIGKTINVRSLGMQHFLSANPSSRIKRETVKLEFSNDGDILEFYIGFRLDGVREYENYTTIDIYTEPTFDFQSSTVLIFKAGERLSFNGEGCDIGITIYDYRINIGKENCVDLELRSNSLSCYPPQTKPATDEDESHTKDPQIIIHIGLNLKHFAGYLRYPDPDRTATSTKLPLHIIIPATVVPAIVIIIVIAAVCAAQRRRACCQRPE